uniref:Uncharacterized protein n=1 Tax=Anguilla anguilla TaxID=7936 RepID=A0A0E9WG07_ANGAN
MSSDSEGETCRSIAHNAFFIPVVRNDSDIEEFELPPKGRKYKKNVLLNKREIGERKKISQVAVVNYVATSYIFRAK